MPDSNPFGLLAWKGGAAVADAGAGDALLRRAFAETSTIAVVGASSNPARASNYVMAFLQTRGWRAIPVNPNEVGGTINGERRFC